MDKGTLPAVSSTKALEFPHFPTRHQAVIWRNYGLVPLERIAKVLKTNTETVKSAAAAMGLEHDDSLCNIWLERGFLSIIRRNWHLLPYEQLLELLDWTAEKLAFVLKEDDFFWIKMGSMKPSCDPVFYRELSAEEETATAHIKDITEKYFADLPPATEKPFDFLTSKNGLGTRDNATDHLRLAYAYAAVYGDPLLHPELDPYTDDVLAEYAASGVNALWLQGTLYTLVPWLGNIPASDGWEIRRENLRRMCTRAAKYGISIFLYTNEPRAMHPDFFQSHPGWKGADASDGLSATMCLSNPEVAAAVSGAYAELFSSIPELGGVFIISMSENLTHCVSRPGDLAAPCPLCSKRRPADIVAQANRIIAEGVHRGNPEAKVIAYTWAWAKEWDEEVIEKLPDDIWIMCVSETAVETDAGGIKGEILDYSIAHPGPGPTARRLWKKAQAKGMRTVAKVQFNNSWELSAVPYIPAMDLVEEHINNLKNAGIGDFMLSWTLGGFPGGNFELLNMDRKELAAARYGKEAAEYILKAWTLFSEGFREFPFHLIETLYNAPHNYGPSNLLFPAPTGYSATMVGFPYDDLFLWRGNGHFPEEIFENQFAVMTEKWSEGLEVLDRAAEHIHTQEQRKNFEELCRISSASYTHLRSTLCQIRFVRARDTGNDYTGILEEEIALAVELAKAVNADSRIGFEASNHYYYTLNDLKEKVLNAVNLLKK